MRFISILLLLLLSRNVLSQNKIFGTTFTGGNTGNGVLYSMNADGSGYTIKKSFDASIPGSGPRYQELIPYNGLLYGVTVNGGTGSGGVLYSWNPATNAYIKLYDFESATGWLPFGKLSLLNNKLYGVTSSGGVNNKGVIYEWDLQTNTYTKRVDLADGSSVQGGLMFNGSFFYGMTSGGGINGFGTLFQWDPLSNVLTKLFDFSASAGGGPAGNLSLFDGKLFGMTSTGGINNKGVLFEYDLSTSIYTKKIEFNGANGQEPYGSLTLQSGKFYGMTYAGGTNNVGVIFEYEPVANVLTVKQNLSSSTAANPFGDLLFYNNTFYGLTRTGGPAALGGLFEWKPSTNIFTALYTFVIADGGNPWGNLTVINDKLYGVNNTGGINSGGTLFEYDLNTQVFIKKIDFNVCPNGDLPRGQLSFYKGKYYGVCYRGGTEGGGTIFEYDPLTNILITKYSLSKLNIYQPDIGLTIFNDKFYGRANLGGLEGRGGFFEWDPVTNQFLKKTDFTLLNGCNPQGRLVTYNNKLYGVMNIGGSGSSGVLYEFDPVSNTYTKKIELTNSTNGYNPQAGLTLFNGKFYGMTRSGGANALGVIYEWNPATNIYTKKIDFASATGSQGSSEMAVQDQKLYGMTSTGGTNNKGVIFQYDPLVNSYTKKIDFDGLNGSTPSISLFTNINGLMYGATTVGGVAERGVCFSYNPATNGLVKLKEFDIQASFPSPVSLDPPLINYFSPVNGVSGTNITVAGVNFTNTSAVSFGGVPASSYNVVSDKLLTATVSGGTSGSIAVTSPMGTGTKQGFSTLSPPGNTLNFDGLNDNVQVINPLGSIFTIEAWIRTSANSFTGSHAYEGNGIIWSDIAGLASSDFSIGLVNNRLYFEDGAGNIATAGTSLLNDGIWHHFAVVRNGVQGQTLVYIDGRLEGANIANNIALNQNPKIVIGGNTLDNRYFNGSIDEVRFWSVGRTQAQIQASMYNSLSLPQNGLLAYYNFDLGIAGGNNATQTFLPDLTGTLDNYGTLFNFNLTGASSNWIESYALIVPTNLVASNVSGNGFTLSWLAPVTGTVNSYLLDVSLSPGFSTFVPGFQNLNIGNTTTYQVTGLSPSKTYYCRLRANKTSVPSQGAYSDRILINTPALPFVLINNFSPTNGAQGTSVVINGAGLATAFSVKFGGVAASSFTVNSDNQITAVVGNGASGAVEVLTSLGTGRLYGFSTLVPPGNALNFDGVNDYVLIDHNASLKPTSQITIEAWIKPTNIRASIYYEIYRKQDNPDIQLFSFQNNGTILSFGLGLNGVYSELDVPINFADYEGQWVHVAATYDGTAKRIYRNGVLIGQQLITGSLATAGNSPAYIGSFNGSSEFFYGLMDEVRIWNVARSASELVSSMTNVLSLPQTGLVAYYNFDQGIAGGSNVGLNSLPDLSGNVYNNAQLYNFALVGGTSNWVESYASVMPTVSGAAEVNATWFIAKWGPPAIGIVQSYILDVAINANFTTFVPGFNGLDVGINQSYIVSGLNPQTTYYYRVRANKTSVGASANSYLMFAVTTSSQSPVISYFSPVNASTGQTITITGSNFTNTTAVTFGGVAASSYIINSTTQITAVVGSGASGSIAVTANGIGSLPGFSLMPPPGNALNFDGINDYVNIAGNSTIPTSGPVSVEAWINYSAGPFNLNWFKRGSTNGYGLYVSNNVINVITYGVINWVTNVVLTPNQWHHIVFTFDGTTQRIYKNGVLAASINQGYLTASNLAHIGANFTGFEAGYFRGSIDELRIWNRALSPAEVFANATNVIPLPQTGLVAYYNFDTGLPNGNNTGQTILPNLTGNIANYGYLLNFSLNGNASNWVESYAMVVPQIQAATNLTSSGFTANWASPANGTAENYLLDVSTSNNFSTFIPGYQSLNVGAVTNYTVTGLTPFTTYYYRLRANKNSVSGQGAYSDTTSASLTVRAPVINSFVPMVGAIGTSVTVKGINFDQSLNDHIIYFGQTKAAVSSVNDTAFVFSVPADGTMKPITIITNGLSASSTKPFVTTFADSNEITQSSFVNTTTISPQSTNQKIVASDFDGDGRIDLGANAYYSGGIAALVVYLNRNTNDSIILAPPVMVPWGYAIDFSVHDFDNDGKMDVATTSRDSVRIYKNTSTLNNIMFTRVWAYKVIDVQRIASGDIDNDGKIDLIACDVGANTVNVFRNLSGMNNISLSSPIIYPVGTNAIRVGISDLDGDRRLDIVLVKEATVSNIFIYRNTSSPGAVSFANKQTINGGAFIRDLAFADIDSDGLTDLVTTSGAVYTDSVATVMAVFKNQSSVGSISLALPEQFQVFGHSDAVSVSDLTGDGRPDVAVTRYIGYPSYTGSFCVFENNSSPGAISFKPRFDFTSPNVVAWEDMGLTVGDFSQDGKPDVAALFNHNSIKVFKNQVRNSGQTINFTSIGNKTFGDLPVKLAATASSNLPVVFRAISGPGIINADTLIIGGAGAIVVQAFQPGNNVYDSAWSQQTVLVDKASQIVIFDSIPNKIFSKTAFPLVANASSGLPVFFSIISGNAYISGNSLYMTGLENITVRASLLESQNYFAAYADRSFCISANPATLIKGETEVCINLQSKYFVDKIFGTNYQWSTTDNNAVINTSGDTALITWSQIGTHQVFVRHSGQCTDSSLAYQLNVNVMANPFTSQFTNLLPFNGDVNQAFPLTFSWTPVGGALTYDLYIWPDSLQRPDIPNFSNLTQINQVVGSSLIYGITYKWQVVTRRACYTVESPIQTFRLRNLPDLTVNKVQVSSTGFSGQALSLNWEVENIGLGGTLNGGWHDAVYLSIDSLLNPAEDIYLGVADNQTALQPGEKYLRTGIFTLPQGLNNNYYLIVVTNSDQYLLESSGTNNKRSSISKVFVQLTSPADLQVVSIVHPTNAFSGQNINVSWKVKNMGPGKTPGSFWVDRIYLSNDAQFNFSTATLLEGFSYQGILNGGEDYTRTRPLQLPEGIFGRYFIYVITDFNNNVYEHATEGNNILRSDSFNVFLTPPIDLVPTQLSAPAIVSTGEVVSFSWKVENGGGSPTGSTSWIDQLYLSQTSTFDPATAIRLRGYPNMQGLNSGDYYISNKQVLIPHIDSGEYYVFVKADENSNVFEYTYKDNNIYKGPNKIKVNSPDLIATNISGPQSDTAGKTISLNWAIHNIGPGSLVNSNTTDRIWVSRDTLFNPVTAREIKTVSYSTGFVSSQGLVQKSISVQLPEGLSGTYYFFVQVDVLNTVFETNDDNNVQRSSQPVQITLGYWADLIVTTLQLSDTLVAGTSPTITFQVQNSGARAIKDSLWSDYLYLSRTSTFSKEQSILLKEFVRINSLAEDSLYEAGGQVTLPDFIGDSIYYLFVYSDANDKIFENTDTINNWKRSNGIYIKKYPPSDLSVISIEAPNSGSTGKSIIIPWTVKNIGTVATLTDQWEDALYLSADSIFDRGTDILVKAVQQVGILDTAETYARRQSFVLPNNAYGEYYLLLVTDHLSNTIDENLSNNYKLTQGGTIQIALSTPSDLVVESFISPTQAPAGQPARVNWQVRNQGPGFSQATRWTDKIYLSTDLVVDASDVLLGSCVRNGSLSSGMFYDTTMEVTLPRQSSGNYVLLLVVDANDNNYEHSAESNNTVASLITIQPQLLSDLIVSAIIVPDSVMAGEPISVQWNVKNAGQNAAEGYMREAIYLSEDTIKDVNDILIAAQRVQINLPSNGETTHSYIGEIKGASFKQYHVLLHTDVSDNIFESDNLNNVSASFDKVRVTVSELPIHQLVQRILPNNKMVYYRIEVPDSLTGESMLVKLSGETSANNQIYLRYGDAPTLAEYDFVYDNSLGGNQEIVVPSLKKGTYYLLVQGNNPIGSQQSIQLLASIIDFEIRFVDANVGGNSGTITMRIKGAKFIPDMYAQLVDSSGATISSSKVLYVDPTSVYATFDLEDESLGIYDVSLFKPDSSIANLENAFTIETGKGQSLSTTLKYPAFVRRNQSFTIQIEFTNNGNNDLPLETRTIISLFDAPIGSTLQELSYDQNQIRMELKELNGPQDVLRPGASGTITIFSKATQRLRFRIVK